MRKKMLCDAKFDLEIEILGPTLIKAGEGSLVGPDMTFVKTRAFGKPTAFLPGTSLKGIFRSHVERVARTLKPRGTPVCLPYQMRGNGEELSCGKRLEKESDKKKAYKEQCLACRMFGSLAFKGRAFIGDAYAKDPKKLNYETRDGVAIDRKTGGSVSGALYDLEVLTTGTFKTSVLLDNFETWQLGALGFVLRDLEDERIRIGSGTSRGLGHVRGRITAAELRYAYSHDGNLCGIGGLLPSGDREDYGVFEGENKKVSLGEPRVSGLWKVYPLSAEKISEVFDAGRDDFMAYLESYPWDGGYQGAAQSQAGAGGSSGGRS